MSSFNDVFVPSESILKFKADSLARSREAGAAAAPASVVVGEDTAALEPLIELYGKHAGDLTAIFAELGDHPGKALKYPPADANEFATKYMGGYFTYIDIKALLAKAGMPVVEAEAAVAEVAEPAADAEAPPAEPEPTPTADAPASPLPASEVVAAPEPELPPSSADEATGSSHVDRRGFSADGLAAMRVTLKKRTAVAEAAPEAAPSEDDTAPLIALYCDHDGDLVKIFRELRESPRKALKHPPSDALDFANKYIAGHLTDYAAPKVASALDDLLNEPDRASTPIQALAAVFPSLPYEVLFAVLEAANGSLDGAVHILLESGANLLHDGTSGGGGGAAHGDDHHEADLSALQQQQLARAPEEDYLLAITVPAHSKPQAMLKITTTIGTVHARVPHGVRPGQSFFIRIRRGSPYADSEAA
jgi:hypothetical protein